MGLLYPGALVFFAIVPALALAYLARERPSRVIVSSAAAFRALRGFRRERFGGWPRLDWMFFVELLILCLAVLAIAGPYVLRKSNPIAVVIDNSAAMQARTAGGKTRFALALEKAGAMLADEDSGSTISLYVTAPQPRRVAPPFASITEAVAALDQLKPSDAPNEQATLIAMLSDLASEGRFNKVIFAGANALMPPVPAKIHAIAVGDPEPNAGIGSFSLRREAFGAAALHAQLTIGNYNPETRNFEVAISGDGKDLGHAKISLAAGETGAVEFPALPSAQVYRAELSPPDSFPLDNVAYATAGAVKAVSILFISPTPADAGGLNSIPGVEVTARTPDAYSPADLDNADLAIFEYTVPKELPAANSLIVMPPAGDPVFNFSATPAPKLQIAGWHNTDPLTDSVNFRLLNLQSGEYLGQHEWMSVVLSGDGGALMLKGEREDHRFVATGFNPFPYLGRRNLPMSVLTLDALSYLAGLGQSSSGYHTGQQWLVPAGVESVILPSGSKVKAHPGTLFPHVDQQGVYELVTADGTKTARAVNVADLGVSDLENLPQLKIEVTSSGTAGEPVSEKASFSAYLIAAILALGLLEALIAYRRRRRTLAEA
jgi:Aerotolerance regulator N-terminal/von Willebrand factor type A domain